MRGSAPVSEEAYLHSSYELECELVDGRLLQRNVGERNHSVMQRELSLFFRARWKQWKVRVFPSLTIRLAPGHYRIPDVCIYKEPAPRHPIFSTPPFIAIEILSKDDRMSRIRRKIDDYLAFGVPYVWIIDPATRKADVCTPTGFHEAKDLILRTENPAIEVRLAEMFAALDT